MKCKWHCPYLREPAWDFHILDTGDTLQICPKSNTVCDWKWIKLFTWCSQKGSKCSALVSEITSSCSHAPISTPLSYISALGSPTPIAACSRLTGEMAAAEDGWHNYAEILGSDLTLCNIKGLIINHFYTVQYLGLSIQVFWLIRGKRWYSIFLNV